MVKADMKTYLKVKKKNIGEGKSCFIVAEAGSNHNGDLTLAKKLIIAAARAGADAVKFQLFKAEELSSEKRIQKILKKFEFKREWVLSLNKFAKSKNIIFFATPFDVEAVDILVNINVPFFKISSGDLTNFPLVKYIAEKNKPIILSVGLANLKEIKETLKLIFRTGNRQILLLHCIVNYPAMIEDLNLQVIPFLKKKFSVPVGFSDHTMSVIVPSIAVSLGASIIEKHFTLSRKLKGPDHPFALEPTEFKIMVENIRNTEKSLGLPVKRISYSEKKGLIAARRSLYARKYISKESVVTNGAIAVLRPCKGIIPKYLERVIGKNVKRNIFPYHPIQWKDLC